MYYLKKAIFPLIWFFFLLYMGRYICIVNGEIDWIRVILLFGIPYGIPYMIFYAPGRFGISGGIGALALELIIGALFGFIIAIVAVVKAFYYLIMIPIQWVMK